MTAAYSPTGVGLVVRQLRKRFDDVLALDGADLVVRPGELVGFLGPNGAGKTTTMRAVMKLLTIDAGSITWDGAPIGEEQRRHIGYLPQERGLYVRMKVREHIAYIGRLAGMSADAAATSADRWIERVGLTERADDLIQELSTGNQQRVQLAVALVHGPELLILDEPFAGLDPVAVANLQSIITEQADSGAGVVFSSHQLTLVQDLCEEVTIIANGATVATGAVRDLRHRASRRVVEIDWVDTDVKWTPTRWQAEDVNEKSGWMRFTVPADTDPADIVADAEAVGSLAAFSFEPPSLDDLFVELVANA